MSLASIALPSISLSSLIQSGLDAQVITTNNSATVAPSLTPAATSTLHNFATDLATIFKELTSDNTDTAYTNLTQLQQALGYAAPGADTSSPLGTLLDSLSNSISSGDTTSAIQDLVSFYKSTGNTSGNVVNTYA